MGLITFPEKHSLAQVRSDTRRFRNLRVQAFEADILKVTLSMSTQLLKKGRAASVRY